MQVGGGGKPRPPVELEEGSALIYTAVPERRPPPHALEKATLTDSGPKTDAETAEPGGQGFPRETAAPRTGGEEVRIALDISEGTPGELSERMGRLRAAVEKCTGRTFSMGGGGSRGGSPASSLELLDMAIASLLETSGSAQGSAGSASELAARSA